MVGNRQAEDLDPLQHGLIFERFLNPDRVSMPDFDVDFDERRRGEVIRYVTEKYGKEYVAQIITYGSIKAKAAVKDSARVLDMPFAIGEQISKAMPPDVMGKGVPLGDLFNEEHKRYAEGNEFRELYENIKGTTPYCVKTVAVLNSWGQQRAWGCHMVHHALYQKQNYSYAGVIEALSGAPFDVKFVSFDDIKADPKVLDGIDVLINVGDGDTAHTGGKVWEDPEISSAVKGFVHRGGGLIGVGEPGGHQYQGRYLQLSAPLGVEKETGFTLNYDKYNWDEHRDHFILADCPDHDVDFGEGKKSIFAWEGTEILIQRDKEVQMAAHEYGKGRGVYISGLPYSFVNNRVLYRAILWAAHDEADLHKWFSTNYNVEVHAYVKNGKYCVVNNTYEPQDTTVYTGDGSCFDLHLDTNEIKWYSIEG